MTTPQAERNPRGEGGLGNERPASPPGESPWPAGFPPRRPLDRGACRRGTGEEPAATPSRDRPARAPSPHGQGFRSARPRSRGVPLLVCPGQEVLGGDGAVGGFSQSHQVPPLRTGLPLLPAMHRDVGDPEQGADVSLLHAAGLSVRDEVHTASYFSGNLPVKSIGWRITPAGMAPGLRLAHPVGMARVKHRSNPTDRKLGPHPWAFLAEWRERLGLTQENVSETFGVTNVTIHRWETGKAPMSVENFFRLAELYGVTPGQLMFSPDDRERAAALQDAWAIIVAMPAKDRESWLAVGRSLAGRSDTPGPGSSSG